MCCYVAELISIGCGNRAGGSPKLTFEGAVKGRLRLIADFSSDLRNATARGLEHLRAELKPPACQVGNGGFREITPETLGQYGARNAHLVRERRNRPRMRWLAMQQGQGFPDFRVTDAGQPPGLFRRKQRDIASQRFDEQHFRQFREHGLTTGPGCIRITHRIADGVFQPLARRVVADTDSSERVAARQGRPG